MSGPFECDLEGRGNEVWVLPTGELDVAAVGEFGESLSLALASEAGSIVIDLRGLELLDSTGLRSLLEAQAGEQGGRISFVPGNEMVHAVLRVSGLLEELRFREAE